MWLKANGREVEFQKRYGELVTQGIEFDERQEMIDQEFGLTYAVLKPYIDQYNADQKVKAKAKNPEPDPEPEVAVERGSPGEEPEPDRALGGDTNDVRWAIANLSKAGLSPRDAPTAIAWNLLAIGRSGIQGQLKLLDIYRATIVQPAAKELSQEGLAGPDDRLADLLERLGDGLEG